MAACEGSPIAATPDGLKLSVRLTPGAKVDRVEGGEVDAAGKSWLRIRVAAPPVDGQANKALVQFLAKRWRLPKSAIAITSGETARNKTLTLQGDPGHLRSLIEAEL